jgi:hypothetical protein
MYGKPVMTCFKHQVYLNGSEAITYLSAIIEWLVVTEPARQYGPVRQPYAYLVPSPIAGLKLPTQNDSSMTRRKIEKGRFIFLTQWRCRRREMD